MDFSVESIKDEFNANVDRYDGGNQLNAGMQGAVIGTLEKACGGKEDRKRVLRLLTGHTSSKELNSAQWSALYSLVLPWKPEGGKWQTGNPNLDEICNILLLADMDQPGQMKFEYPEFQEVTSKDWEEHVEELKIQDDYEPPF